MSELSSIPWLASFAGGVTRVGFAASCFGFLFRLRLWREDGVGFGEEVGLVLAVETDLRREGKPDREAGQFAVCGYVDGCK